MSSPLNKMSFPCIPNSKLPNLLYSTLVFYLCLQIKYILNKN